MSPLEFIVIILMFILNGLYELNDLVGLFIDELIGKLLDWLDDQEFYSHNLP